MKHHVPPNQRGLTVRGPNAKEITRREFVQTGAAVGAAAIVPDRISGRPLRS